MKNVLGILITCLVLASCGSSRKTVENLTEQKVPMDIPAESKIESPEVDVFDTAPDILQVPVQQNEPQQEETLDDFQEFEEGRSTQPVFDHGSWHHLVQDYVSIDGIVDYQGFGRNWDRLREYIASLGENLPKESWTHEDLLAYWMNAYNAMTVDLILRNLPLKSIKNIDKPWEQRLWKLGDKWYNLDEIEHRILRKMGDPRIHFGINCASFSCPPLLNEAFSSDEVNTQLDQLARNFINDERRNQISENNIKISKLFSWFAKDFMEQGTLIEFLNRYSNSPINPDARKSYLSYDWTLNN